MLDPRGTRFAEILVFMRLLAVFMAGLLVGTGCAANSYQIPNGELQRLSMTPPEQRAQRVLVSQEISATDVAPADRVETSTTIIWVPEIRIGGTYSGGGGRGHGGVVSTGGSSGGGKGGNMKLGSGGGDGKAAAIAFLVIAAVAVFVVAGIEGSRFDGWVQLHPMHPVHLIGKDGSQTVMPLAWIDPQAAAWTETAIVRPTEGPWYQLDRKPLTRGATYSMYGGSGTSRSVTGDVGAGPSFVVQGGWYPHQMVGVQATISLAWRDNRFGGTLYDSRYIAELDFMPLALGKFHLGGYVGAGLAYRFEDVPGGTVTGNNGSGAFTGGLMAQFELHTRIALTARLGAVKAHEDRMTDLLFGISVY